MVIDSLYRLADSNQLIEQNVQNAVTKGWLTNMGDVVYLLNKIYPEMITTELELKAAKILKFKWLDDQYYVDNTTGYYDADLNLTLAIADIDRNSFNQLLSLIKLAEEMGQDPGDQYISDIDNVVHVINLQAFKIMMLNYGAFYYQLWSHYGTIKDAIVQATSITELDALVYQH